MDSRGLEIVLRCRYADRCPYYSAEAFTCNTYTAEGSYCGVYREFSLTSLSKQKKENNARQELPEPIVPDNLL